MEKLLECILECHTLEDAKEILYKNVDITLHVEKALYFAIQSHKGQYRKSGEEYCIHPILVASFVGYLGGGEAMVIAALLHDVVEDTQCSIEDIKNEFNIEVAKLVEGLTKIMEIRQDKLVPSHSNVSLVKSALSFHKMLLASISDVRVLVIKLCDRLHNMLTIDALSEQKQKRISEETLLVYAPIAHRLGMASVKNMLEDLSFEKALPEEYAKIDTYIKEHRQQIQLRLNHFIDKTQILMLQNGFIDGSFEIEKRIKHHYSIYLKMQRKGISIEEVLDLVAIRILVQTPLDCYKVLGVLHQYFNPLIARFKDYVAIPKENGYQTIHTTLFDDTAIIEGQIRTFDMHKTAEYGVAAHWKYKFDGINPSLGWLSDLRVENEQSQENIEAFGFKNRIFLHRGKAEEVLSDIEDTFDFIFIDSAKSGYRKIFDQSLEKLNKGGYIVCDNVLLKGSVAGKSLPKVRRFRTSISRMRDFLDYINDEDRFDTVILSVSDGVSITSLKDNKKGQYE